MLFSMKWKWNPYSVRRSSGRARLEKRFEKAITFDPTVGSRSLLLEFPDALVLGVDEESIFGDDEVSSCQA